MDRKLTEKEKFIEVAVFGVAVLLIVASYIKIWFL